MPPAGKKIATMKGETVVTTGTETGTETDGGIGVVTEMTAKELVAATTGSHVANDLVLGLIRGRVGRPLHAGLRGDTALALPADVGPALAAHTTRKTIRLHVRWEVL